MKHIYATLLASLVVNGLSAQSPCLIASYPFEGNANDVTGNGHDGIVIGATLAPDRFGSPNNAYVFDGINDLIKLTGTFAGSAGTVSAWMRVNNLDNVVYSLVSWRDTLVNSTALTLAVSGTSDPDPMKLFNGTDLRECGSPADIYFELTDAQVPEQLWTHFALTSDGSEIRLYLNGQLAATHGDAIAGQWWDDLCSTGNVGAYLGYDGRPSSEFYYEGALDDVRIFDCALPNEQVDSVYIAESIPPPCLIASYPFDGNALDITGNGHDGIVSGATPAVDRFSNANSAYQFDGIDDFIDISGTWTGSNGTISAWIYIDDLNDYRPIFHHDDNDNLGNAMSLNIDPSFSPDPGWLWYAFDHRECIGGPTLYFTETQPQPPTGAWVHVAVTADDASVHLFINCVEVAVYLPDGLTNPGLWFEDLCAGPFTTLIGSNGTDHFKGRIDDLQVYDCALSALEISALCDLGTAVASTESRPSLMAYPNPTSGSVTITSKYSISNTNAVEVFDAQGRLMSAIPTMKHSSGKCTLDLSGLPEGLYTLRCSGAAHRIMKQD